MSLSWMRAAGLLLVLAAAPVRAEDAQVIIDEFAFSPKTVTVTAGARVTWINHDDDPHTIRAKDAAELRSSALDQNQSYSFTFTTPGTYAYYCSLHPHMTGTIVVK